MTMLHLHQHLKNNLANNPLPGWDAQKLLMPQGRDTLQYDSASLQAAAVLILLYPKSGEWYFPLIQRAVDGFAHSGQMALPGGSQEAAEELEYTALRETHEEIGVEVLPQNVVGTLTPLPIPVSQYLVTPFVAVIDSLPSFTPDSREVDHIVEVPLEKLLEHQPKMMQRAFKGRTFEIPFFDLENKTVWGATSMILSEFKTLLKGYADSTPPNPKS